MIKVRVDGRVLHLPTLKGIDGKSAYEYALDAGFEGTEEDFMNHLVNSNNDLYDEIDKLSKDLSTHKSSSTAHSISTLSTNLNNHKNDTTAHPGKNALVSAVLDALEVWNGGTF